MKEKLHVWALTLSLAVVSALWLMIVAWLGALGWGTPVIELMSAYYIGYAPTFIGGLVGIVWGAILGGLCGCLIAVFYNLFFCKRCKK